VSVNIIDYHEISFPFACLFHLSNYSDCCLIMLSSPQETNKLPLLYGWNDIRATTNASYAAFCVSLPFSLTFVPRFIQ
jgi:hypothetical protein